MLNVTQAQLLNGEYYFDTDPGAGNATALSATDGSYNQWMEMINTSANNLSLSPGIHLLGIRVKSKDGNWSPAFKSAIKITDATTQKSIQIAAAEYYIDNDPGTGAATPMLAIDGNFNQMIETVSANFNSNLSVGYHLLGMRVKSQDGSWSPTFKSALHITTQSAVRNIQITAGEYYIDSDPGTGSATPMLVIDGNFDEVLEALSDTIKNNQLSVGYHKMGLRVKSADGSWSPDFKTVFLTTTPGTIRNMQIQNAEYYIDNDPGVGSGILVLAADGNFDQFIENLIYNAQNQPTLSFGYHLIGLRVQSKDGSWSSTFKQTVKVDNSIYLADVNNSDTVCESNGLNGYQYELKTQLSGTCTWNVTGGSIASGQNQKIVTVNWALNGTHKISLDYISGNTTTTVSIPVSIFAAADASISQSGDELIANADNVQYQWLDCDNGYTPITGATQKNYLPSTTGNYAVRITQNNCNTTSNCVFVLLTTKSESVQKSHFTLYPNPTNSSVNLLRDNNALVQIFVYDNLGNELQHFNSNNNNQNIDLSAYTEGIYFICIQHNEQKEYLKVVKQ